MPLGSFVATSFVVLAGTVGLLGCGGDDGGTMRATLTDDGCTYEGDTTPAAGVFSIEVRNETRLYELADGATIEDIAPAYEKAQARVRADGSATRGPRTVQEADLERDGRTRATSELPANESTGR